MFLIINQYTNKQYFAAFFNEGNAQTKADLLNADLIRSEWLVMELGE